MRVTTVGHAPLPHSPPETAAPRGFLRHPFRGKAVDPTHIVMRRFMPSAGTRDIPWRWAPGRGRVPNVLPVPPTDVPALSSWFAPERPGPLIYQHVARTGHGRCRVDRWPDPRVVLAELPGNYALRGKPDAIAPEELADITGFVEAPPAWLPALRATDPGTGEWDRVIAVLPDEVPTPPPDPRVRRLTPDVAPALRGLGSDCTWISE